MDLSTIATLVPFIILIIILIIIPIWIVTKIIKKHAEKQKKYENDIQEIKNRLNKIEQNQNTNAKETNSSEWHSI